MMKIHPEIKAIESGDIDMPIQAWVPSDSSWQLAIEVSIGTEDGIGADLFQLIVCSENYVKDAIVRSGWLMLGRTVVLKTFSYDLLHSAIQSTLAEVAESSRDWSDFAQGLNWYMQWEFENYIA